MATHKQRVFKFDLRTKKITEVGKGAIGVIMLTSKPYAVEDGYTLNSAGPAVSDGLLKYLLRRTVVPTEKPTAVAPLLASAELRIASGKYKNWRQEQAVALAPTVFSGELKRMRFSYTSWPQEKAQAASAVIAAGELKRILVHNTTWPQDRYVAVAPTIASAQLIPKP